jgi:uncharacterized tellurite resistance protein B-like protein
MDISDFYMSVGQKRNISHFANIVRIAKADGIVTEEEIIFLQKVANKYDIEDDKFKEILKNPDKFPTIGHLECLERIERLYDLVIMIRADHVVAKEEVSVLRKIVVGLAFPLHEIDEIIDKAVNFETEDSNVESFQKEILQIAKSNKNTFV